MSISQKIDFAVIIDVCKANPNGDPLDENRPRVDFDGYGEISDVCLKRKIRDRLAEDGKSIFVVTSGNEVDGQKSLKDRFNSFYKKSTTVQELCSNWFDVRAFGQVFAFKKGDTFDSVSISVRGPVSIQTATTLKPVCVSSMQITKSVNSEPTDDGKKSSDTMGMKHRVDHGIYVTYGAISPKLAEKTGFDDKDSEDLKKVLINLFDGDSSAARPEGSMHVKAVVWWSHGCTSGKHSSYVVHNSLKSYLNDNNDVSVDNMRDYLKSCFNDLEIEVEDGL